MNKFFRSGMLLIAGSMAIWGCSETMPEHSSAIAVSVSVEGRTKGVETTTDNIDSFYMDVITGQESRLGRPYLKYISKALVTKSSTDWQTDKPYYWVEDTDLYFWSWSPVSPAGALNITGESASGHESEIDFTYAVASDPADMDDLIFAYSIEMRRADEENENIIDGGTTTDSESSIANTNLVNMRFFHALSEISFAVSTDDGTFDNDLAIESIRMESVSGSGSCTFDGLSGRDGFSWAPETSASDICSYEIGLDNTKSVSADTGNWKLGSYTGAEGTRNLYSTKNLMFLIPQDHSALSTLGDAFISVTFKRLSTGNVETVTVKINDIWRAGYYYIYKLKASTVAREILLDYDLIVADWIDGSKTLSL